MPKAPDARLGTIAWVDLTVTDAPGLRDFYSAVTGWVPEALSMGEYDDYVMNAPTSGTATAGVCHSRGGNAGLPSQWLVYVIVDNLEARLEACRVRGGEVIAAPRSMGGTARYAVIRDPAGAVVALYQGALPATSDAKTKTRKKTKSKKRVRKNRSKSTKKRARKRSTRAATMPTRKKSSRTR